MKRGTAAKVILGKNTLMDVPAGIVHGTDVILGGKAGLLNDFGGLVLSNNLMIGKKVSRGTIITVTVRGQSPLALPDAIAGSLQTVKAFGGTEQRSLPQGYQQLVSLTTGDASYFDADYIINSFDVDVTTDAAMTLLASGPNMLWGFMGSNNNLPCWGVGSYQNNWLYSANITSSGSVIQLDTNRHITVNKLYYSGDTPVYKMTIDGVAASSEFVVSNAETMEGNTLSTFVGARNNSGTAGAFNPSTFYSFKIEKAGELVVNMVPAKRLSDNVVGFYDTVRDRFFTNAGTGTITAGAAAVPTPDAPMDIISNNGVLKVRHQSGLPLGYTLLDYIATAGGSYINTGITPTINAKADVKFAPTQTNATGYWGARSDPNRFCCTTFSSGAQFSVGMTNNTWPANRIAVVLDSIYDCVIANGYANVNGTEYTETPVESFGNASTFCLGRVVTTGGPSYSAAKYYKCKLWENNVLVFDGIPAKNANGVFGMYDLVSGQFFTNQGLGVFIEGPAVSDPIEIYTDGTVETINAHGKNLWTGDFSQFDNIGGEGGLYAYFKLPKENTYYTLSVTAKKDYTASNIVALGFSTVGGDTMGGLKWIISTSGTILKGETVKFNNYHNSKFLNFVSMYRSDSTTFDYITEYFDIQLEEGVDATEYEPYYNGGTATAEMLLKVGDYQDVQSIIDGVVTKNVGVKVFDGTENWNIIPTAYADGTHRIYTNDFGYNQATNGISTHFVEAPLADRDLPTGQQGKMYHSIQSFHLRATQFTSLEVAKQWLADQYAAGTPVIVVCPLETPTTESVAGQTLQVTDGDNIVEITQASLNGLELEATYQSLVQLTIQEVEDANLNNNVEVTIS